MKKTFFLLVFIVSPAFAELSGRVFSIHDGDTIIVQESVTGKKLKIRLLGVDTPEVDFNGHSQGEVALAAREHLRSLLPLQAQVIVRPQEKSLDANGRYLSQVFYQGQDINYQMLQAGWGALYFIYPFDKKIVSTYMAVAQEAVLGRRGIFSKAFEKEELAYIFRQNVKGLPGNNLVADFQTKELKEHIEDVPVQRRVFFPAESIAFAQGYHW